MRVGKWTGPAACAAMLLTSRAMALDLSEWSSIQMPPPELKPATVDVVFLNAMYGNIADKPAACSHIARVLRSGGRMAVSHPEGREFIEELRATSDYFLESFPKQKEFEELLPPFGLQMTNYRDEAKLYMMIAQKGGNDGRIRENDGDQGHEDVPGS